MDALLGPTINGYNYPINVYPAGSYGYTVSPQGGDAGTPVPVNYPAGLGTSVAANFKGSGNEASLTTTVSGDTLGFGGTSNTNGPLMNGQLTSGSATADANVVFNTKVTNAGGVEIANQATITLTPNSTRPQSVWYTVSASGTVGATGNGTLATQVPYTHTDDENNNIFAVSTGKIPGATNSGNGGYGFGMGNAVNTSSLNNGNTYTTTTCGNQNGSANSTTYGQPFKALSTNLTTNNTASPTISISQNYLPLGITANVKDAYFNHNGII